MHPGCGEPRTVFMTRSCSRLSKCPPCMWQSRLFLVPSAPESHDGIVTDWDGQYVGHNFNPSDVAKYFVRILAEQGLSRIESIGHRWFLSFFAEGKAGLRGSMGQVPPWRRHWQPVVYTPSAPCLFSRADDRLRTSATEPSFGQHGYHRMKIGTIFDGMGFLSSFVGCRWPRKSPGRRFVVLLRNSSGP